MAQPIYNLTGDLTVDDCEGFFLDSDAASDGVSYGHGEDFTFTICVPDAEYIEMFFSEFNTEFGLDVLTIYDGPDVNSPVIGSYSGFGTLPPAVISSGNCLTIHWTSDVDGVAGTGWNAFWQAEVIEPTIPVVAFNPVAPTCSTSTIQMVFDTPIECDSVYPGAVIFTGEINQTVTNVTPLDCNAGEATTFELELAPGLDESGAYHLDYTYYYTDDCQNVFELEIDGDFVVSDCPLDVDLFLDANSICAGECTEIWAEVTGGDPNTYNFNWSPALPNSEGPHQVCLAATQVYTLTVSDAAGSTPSNESITLTVIPAPTLTPAGPVCQQDPPFSIGANPAGGTWYGSHIDGNDQLFHPDSGNGFPWSYYQSPQGCWDSLQIEVVEVDPGVDQASCAGAPPFMMQNFSPAGGTWSGPNITPAGMFNPSTLGTFTVTYTAPNGCAGSVDVNVGPIVIDPVAPVCQSDDPFNLTVNPFGGTWAGVGIEDAYYGTFNPDAAGGGIHTLTYTINGCTETIDIEVIQIDAYWDFSACPSETPFQLTGSPAGGTWSGNGVSPTGLYDPFGIPNGTNDILTYTVNGCSDTRIAYVRVTTINPTQVEFCTYDDPLTLNWAGIQRYPGGGTWTGPGTDNIDAGHFTPGIAGPGTHLIYYEMNTCIDSVLMVVNSNVMQDTTICEQADPFDLVATPVGGTWNGDHVTDQLSGTFDPQSSGLGIHWVYYEAPSGCWDSLTVDVYDLEPAVINGLESNYCYVDSAISLTGTPIGGVFSGAGITDSIFNPLEAGTGLHQIHYTHGTGECVVQTSDFVNVSVPISTTPSSNLLICAGDEAIVGVEADGGSGMNFTYDWTPDVTWLSETSVFPDTNTLYMIEVGDGCSQSDTAYVQVNVEPEIELSVTTSEPQCQGELGNASITVGPGSNYDVVWNVDPPTSGTSLLAPVAHTYQVTITEPISGCSKDTNIFIPSHPNVTAYFTQNPNVGCLGEADPTAEFLDLSEGGVNGIWDFGDGTTEPYEFGVYPTHTYPDTGHFPVSLYIENEEGTCTDSFEFVLCVQPEFKLWIPSAFTPNGDGLNDLFEIVSSGVVEFQLEILSRWGHEIYRMNSLEDPWWDGTFKGELLPEDYYTWSVVVKARHLGGFLHEKNSGQVMLLRTQ